MKILLLSGLYFMPIFALAQNAISGVVNEYAAVISIDSCTGTLTVNNPAPFLPGSRVLLIQMKGAASQIANNTGFGTITDVGCAGCYEWNSIVSRTDQNLVLERAILHPYQPGQGLQIVLVPEFPSAVVSQTLTAPPWNGSTGGILALDVQTTLSLLADVDVSGKGFRGGTADISTGNNCSWILPQTGYSFGAGNWRGALKGEGISQFITGFEAGRGAWSNGGGGGNDHNSGGGGGGHFAAGGRGGTNEEPSNFGCQGNFPGIGGHGLPSIQNRIFFGGGGGAGHENNDFGSDGGAGGGIIIIRASSVNGNGFAFRASGMQADTSLSDGAGGGGAGGTILLYSDSISNLTLEAKGGNGGHANNANGQRCTGPGGGGAGGRISIPPTLFLPLESVAPGMPGKSLQSTSCPEGSNSAQSGEAGTVEFHSGILQEHTTPNPPMPFADFTPIVNGLNVQFENNSLRSLSFLWNFGDGNTSVLEEPQHNFPGPGVYSVTLVAFNSCGNDTLSIEIQLGQLPQAAFSQTVSAGCAPVLVQFQNQSTGDFQLILWHFPGGNPEYSNLDNPSVVYSLPGVYDVRLSLFTLTDTFQIVSENAVSVTPFPEPSFTFNIQGLTVFFENTSQHSTSFNWIFGDGTTSQLESPSHTYNAPGVYAVTLNAQRPLCATSTSSNVVLLPSSTTDSDLFHHLEIFPNPASDKFFVKWKGASAEPIRYGLWHSSGMRLQSGEFYEQTEIITVNYPVGLYYLRIQHGQSDYSKKIVLWR